MTITEMDLTHLVAVEKLENKCFSLPWSIDMLMAELINPDCRYFVALQDDVVLGYCGMQRVLDEGYINNIAVDPLLRRRGIASTMIEKLIDTAVSLKLAFLTLEVRESNHPAIALYEKYDFRKVGKRRGYYQRPIEDAILMTLFFNDMEADKQC